MADIREQAATSAPTVDVPTALPKQENVDNAVEKATSAENDNAAENANVAEDGRKDGDVGPENASDSAIGLAEKVEADVKTMEIDGGVPEVQKEGTEGEEPGNGCAGDVVPALEETADSKRDNLKESMDKDEEPAAKKQKQENGEKGELLPVQLGPKIFHSSLEMFTWFHELLHGWSHNHDLNEYEFMVLSDLLLKGHHEAQSKVGCGIQAFQVRSHPDFGSPCYYLVRKDGSLEDFSYRKCIDALMPLPPNLLIRHQGEGWGKGKGGGRTWGKGQRGSPGRGGRGRGHWGGRGNRGRGNW